MSVQSWLNRIWYDRAPPPWWLLPLSLTYGAVAGLRRYLYVKRLRKSIQVSLPVVVVGNLSVGGTGKTVCSNSNMPGSTAGTFTLVVKVNAGTANGTVISEIASVSSSATCRRRGSRSRGGGRSNG